MTDDFVLDDIFKFTSEDLADSGLRQRIHENDLTRNLIARELCAAVLHNVVAGERADALELGGLLADEVVEV